MKSTKRWASLLAAGALSVTLAACGGDTDGDKGGSSTDGASTSAGTGAAGEPDAAADAEPGSEISPADFIAMLKSPGEEKLSSYDLTMTMPMQGQEMKAEGSMNLGGDQPAMDLKMAMPGVGDAHMILVGEKMYMSVPGMTAEGKFVEVPKDQMGDMGAVEDIDVTTMFDEWEKTAKKVVFVGEEDVDGTTMRHYEVTSEMSLGDAAGATSAGPDSAAASSGGAQQMTQDVWVDSDNLMRKATAEVDGEVMEMHMSNWGEAKEITAPSGDQVQTLDELTQNPGGDGAGATG